MKIFEWLSPDQLLADDRWWDIYHSSFSRFELDPKESLVFALNKHILKIGRYQQDNHTVAISVIQPMQRLPFTLLNYFAIAKPNRGNSLGSQLFLSLIQAGDYFFKSNREEYLGLIWEVENPDAEADISQQLIKQRRMQFYHKHGAHCFQHPFIQPPLVDQQVVMMNLMYHSDRIIDYPLEKEIIETIYFEKYQTINHIEVPILMKLLAECCKSE